MARGIGDKALKKVFHFAIHSGYSLGSICNTPEMLMTALGRNRIQDTIDSINSNSALARSLTTRLRNEGIDIIPEYEEAYPLYLRESLLDDCPPVLFVKGNKKLLSSISVGFCGSRKVSEKGEIITEQCASQLAKQNITVVSGYASGTDLAAHVAALNNNGSTIFVLAEGIFNRTIKQRVRPLLNDSNHVFVSQFLPVAQWNVGNAMKRNGLIIGLSRAMILVESGKTGGTFAAGEETLKLGKPLFVIDFEKPEVSAEANPYFIAHGGRPIRGKNGVPSLGRVLQSIDEKRNYRVPEQLEIESLIFS